MAERDNSEREFERIFGKVEKSDHADVVQSESMYGATQKLPSDSDLLGIRTDSDRFIMRNPLPERLPAEHRLQDPAESRITGQEADPHTADTPDRMTIEQLNNITAVPKSGTGNVAPGSQQETSATQLFSNPVRRETLKASNNTSRPPSGLAAAPKDNGDFALTFDTKSGASAPSPTTEFRRVPHVEDAISFPKPVAPSAVSNPTVRPAVGDTATRVAPVAPTSATSGPSDFTRIVKGSELRALQEKLAAASGGTTSAPNVWPRNPAPMSPAPPAGMATQIWSASSSTLPPQQVAVPQPWPSQVANLPPAPRAPELPAPEPSKLSQYMPLILVLNLLFLLAILLVVFFFFAFKK